MYNVYKKLTGYAAMFAAVLTICSCSGNVNNDAAQAEIMFERAQNALNGGDPQHCIELLDSLDKKYSAQSDVMKRSIALRPKALLGLTEAEITVTDSIINTNKFLLDSLKPLMVHIDIPGTEGYVIKQSAYDPDLMNKTGISARVSEIGEFYIVSSVNPASDLQHWSVSAVVGDMIATTDTVIYDGALNFRMNNGEVITFTPSGSEGFGKLIAENVGLPVQVLFNSQNGRSHSITLNAAQVDGIATAYNYARAINDMRNATVNMERLTTRRGKLNQQLQDATEPKTEPINTDPQAEE